MISACIFGAGAMTWSLVLERAVFCLMYSLCEGHDLVSGGGEGLYSVAHLFSVFEEHGVGRGEEWLALVFFLSGGFFLLLFFLSLSLLA